MRGLRRPDLRRPPAADESDEAAFYVLEVIGETREEQIDRRLLCLDCYADVWTYRTDR